MNSVEIMQLKKLLVGTSIYYGQQLDDSVLQLFVEDLKDLDFGKVAKAIKDVRLDPKTTRCPLPAVIRAKITPADTDENKAIDAVARIIKAVSDYGWNNHDAAKAYIGELGWRVVALEGGWHNVCESLTHDRIGTLRAQWRSTALTQIQRDKTGSYDHAPMLPTSEGKALVNNLLSSMPRMELV